MNTNWIRINRFEQTLFLRNDSDVLPSNVGHFHQDLGHFCMYKNGLPVLVDGGRIDYSASRWSRFGRYPEAHNAVMIDGLGLLPRRPSLYPSGYSKGKYAAQLIESARYSGVQIESDGFQRIRKDMMWKRALKLFDGGVEIVDEVTGCGDHLFRSFFHWAPELDISFCKKNEYIISGDDINGSALLVMPSDINIRIHKGGESPLGWQAISYGQVIEASTMELSGRIQLPVRISFNLVWSKF